MLNPPYKGCGFNALLVYKKSGIYTYSFEAKLMKQLQS